MPLYLLSQLFIECPFLEQCIHQCIVSSLFSTALLCLIPLSARLEAKRDLALQSSRLTAKVSPDCVLWNLHYAPKFASMLSRWDDFIQWVQIYLFSQIFFFFYWFQPKSIQVCSKRGAWLHGTVFKVKFCFVFFWNYVSLLSIYKAVTFWFIIPNLVKFTVFFYHDLWSIYLLFTWFLIYNFSHFD